MTKNTHDADVAFIQALAELLNENDLTELQVKRDYAEAGVPMLPVITTVGHTIQQIFYYTLVLVGLSVVFALTKAVGLIYLASALVLGGIYIWMAWRLSRNQTNSEAKKIYLYSLLYLALLFAAIMVDSAVHL